MSDNLPTVWPAERHTLAKHAILKKYLEAWMPIVSRQTACHGSAQFLRYIDGFAGPGEYTGGEPGSPFLALQAALGHSQKFPVPLRYSFIENREDRFQHLQRVLSRHDDLIQTSSNVMDYEVISSDCDDALNDLLDKHDRSFGPAMVFLDQFGYSAVSIELIGRIMRHPVCEIFSYLDWKDMNRFITDSTKWPGLTKTFGGDEWKPAIEMAPADREPFLLKTYITALQERAAVEFSCYFSMHDETGQLLYWLFFSTGNLRGLEEMKRSMWSVDETGSFQFSDADTPGQLLLLNGFDQQWLAQDMRKRHRDEVLTLGQIRRSTLIKTPCYRYKEALGILEKEKHLEIVCAPPGRRKRTFKEPPPPDDSQFQVRFR